VAGYCEYSNPWVTNPSSQVLQGTEFFTVASNICGSSKWKLLHITLDGAWNFELAHRFLENWCILVNNSFLVPRNVSDALPRRLTLSVFDLWLLVLPEDENLNVDVVPVTLFLL